MTISDNRISFAEICEGKTAKIAAYKSKKGHEGWALFINNQFSAFCGKSIKELVGKDLHQLEGKRQLLIEKGAALVECQGEEGQDFWLFCLPGLEFTDSVDL